MTSINLNVVRARSRIIKIPILILIFGSILTSAVSATIPVGAVYICGETTDPYTLLGFGTWQKLTDL